MKGLKDASMNFSILEKLTVRNTAPLKLKSVRKKRSDQGQMFGEKFVGMVENVRLLTKQSNKTLFMASMKLHLTLPNNSYIVG